MSATRVLFVHGAPAVGKLTIANAIASRVRAANIDNHVLIDFAKSVFEFGAEGFFDLVRDSRVMAQQYAIRFNVPLVIFTSCYSDPEDRKQLEEIEAELKDPARQLLPVYLFCSKEVQHARVGNPDRAERGKLTEVPALENFERQWNFVAVPRDQVLSIDTTGDRPENVASQIIKHFKLD